VFGFLVILYFLLACLLVWVALFPEGRKYCVNLLQILQGTLHRWQRRACHLSNHAGSSVTGLSKKTTAVSGGVALWISKYRWGVALGLSLVLLPPLGILVFSSGVYLEGFADGQARIDPQVASLLKGEQLVPPAPLPPDLFVAADLLQVRPSLQSASRNWQLLDAEFSQRLLLVFKIMREKYGYEVAILEGYRSPERQNMLSSMGSHVTSAKAFQSYHQYGLAADCAFLLNGKLILSEKDPWAMQAYVRYGEVAESLGLTWGGRWKLMDFGHIEWRKPGGLK
jgi:peptidoglycan L-alanyl-D-glutamate endopeptidase CwlK